MPRIEALTLVDELQPGQNWDDIVSVPMTRMQYNVVFTLMMGQVAVITGAMDDCAEDARRGEFTAIMMLPLLRDTAQQVADIVKALGAVVAPESMARVDAEIEKRHADR